MQLLRLPALQARLGGMGRSSIYRWIDLGLFPPPIKIGPRAIVWRSEEADAIAAARIACKSDDEIRKLVEQLVAARRKMAA